MLLLYLWQRRGEGWNRDLLRLASFYTEDEPLRLLDLQLPVGDFDSWSNTGIWQLIGAHSHGQISGNHAGQQVSSKYQSLQSRLSAWSMRSSMDRPSMNVVHFTLYTPHFALYTPHFTLYTPHFTLHTWHFTLTLHTPHFTLYTLHSTLVTPTLYTLHFPLHTSQFPLNALHFTLHTLHSLSLLAQLWFRGSLSYVWAFGFVGFISFSCPSLPEKTNQCETLDWPCWQADRPPSSQSPLWHVWTI